MKRILALTTAALMSTGIAGTALAQGVDIDTGVEAGVEAGASATAPGTDAHTTGAVGAGANVGAVISAINTGQLGTAELQNATEISSVTVIRIDEMPGGEQQAAIDEALDRHQAEVDDLRAAVEANAELQSELEAEGVSADDVVAAQVEADGSVTVYVR